MQHLITELKERRIWRVLVAYPSLVFVVLQVVEFFVNNYDLDARLLTATIVVSVVLLPAAFIWNWRHGEVGAQALSKGEVGVYVMSVVCAVVAMGWYWNSTPASNRTLAPGRLPSCHLRMRAMMPTCNIFAMELLKA
jgi:hypothetical protein